MRLITRRANLIRQRHFGTRLFLIAAISSLGLAVVITVTFADEPSLTSPASVEPNLANRNVFSFLKLPMQGRQPINRRRSAKSSAFSAADYFVPPIPEAGTSKIVFASNREGSMQIYVMNADGTGVVRLTNSGANDDCPRWSPEGARILFQSDRENPFSGNYDIYVMNADGSGVARLTTDANDDRLPAWSPDGTRIIFQTLRNGSKYQVYVMNADGSNQANLSNSTSNDSEPSWSPDGGRIAFSSDRDGTTNLSLSNIYVMNSYGTGQQRITFSSGDVQDSQPAWSPDGSRIAFVSTRDSTTETWQETDDYEIPDDDGQVTAKSRITINKEVYVMNADGSGQTRLTNDLGNDDSPAWSPDGTKIMFRSDRERDGSDPMAQLWTMNVDGTAQTDLSATSDGDYSASLLVTEDSSSNAATDGSLNATASLVIINFDSLPTNTPVTNQYQVATFSSYTGGTVSTAYDANLGGSYPNGIIATSGYGSTYWPSADLYVNFAMPVNGLTFRILGVQGGGANATIDVYANNSYYTTRYFSSGIGFPGQIRPPFIINLSDIPHVTGISIHNVINNAFFSTLPYLVYYDDFAFTPELSLNITSPRISGGLDHTTQSALLGADISLTAAATQSGGSYSWTFSGPSSAASLSGQTVTFRSTATTAAPDNGGPIVARATYALNNVSLTATVTINSVLPTVTNFSGQQTSDTIVAPGGCGDVIGWWWYRLGCSPQQADGIQFSANVHVPTIISVPSQSGMKFVQAVSTYRKKLTRGIRCLTRRSTESDADSGWQLDYADPYDPPHFFSEGNDLVMSAVDSPGANLTKILTYDFVDAAYIDDRFDMYLIYFTTATPATTRPLRMVPWSWNGQAVFEWNGSDAVHRINFTNAVQTTRPSEAATSIVNMNGIVQNNQEVQCPGGPAITNNRIDSSRYFVRQHYLDFLGREPDLPGWNFWTSNISQCEFDLDCVHMQRIHIGLAFFYSGEFIGSDPEMANPPGTPGFNPAVYNRKFVYWCYMKYLHRDPHDTTEDVEGWKFWTDNLTANGNYGHIIDAFQLSDHYRNPFAQ